MYVWLYVCLFVCFRFSSGSEDGGWLQTQTGVDVCGGPSKSHLICRSRTLSAVRSWPYVAEQLTGEVWSSAFQLYVGREDRKKENKNRPNCPITTQVVIFVNFDFVFGSGSARSVLYRAE